MKELEKTKRISISTVLFILVLVIGVLTFKQPRNVYKKTQEETLTAIKSTDYLVHLEDIVNKNPVIIDVRSKSEYTISHIENAINIPTAEILENKSISLLNDVKNTGETSFIYGKNPEEANSSWMLLYQLGYDNMKILNVETHHIDNKLVVRNYSLEKPIANYADIFKTIAPEKIEKVKKTVPKPRKKVIPVKKKKKRKPEGGC